MYHVTIQCNNNDKKGGGRGGLASIRRMVFFRGVDTPMHIVIGPPVVARRVLEKRVCPFFHPSFCQGVFVELLVFSKFWHGARKPYEVVRDGTVSPRIGKMD